MKKNFKSILLLLVAMFFMAMAIGCSSSETQNDPKPSEEPKTEAPNEEKPAEEIDYPTKPIQVIAPVGAGGDTDRNTRNLARFLEDELGKPVVVLT
ncbi:hypothetical protein [Anaerobacillus sp. CMMVII]|uniref:hypothetical protein n=1 Tax=Anaerobacillus sp. CMMVII TaxID=2755588 RepID=UPI0021B849E0|nr:hypothetical protein [Anaerobacillus sp. CMMVII]